VSDNVEKRFKTGDDDYDGHIWPTHMLRQSGIEPSTRDAAYASFGGRGLRKSSLFTSTIIRITICEQNAVPLTVMRRITTFRSTTDRIYDGGPIILYYRCVTTAYNIQYSNMLYRFVA
jgi:hypothetical protein